MILAFAVVIIARNPTRDLLIASAYTIATVSRPFRIQYQALRTNQLKTIGWDFAPSIRTVGEAKVTDRRTTTGLGRLCSGAVARAVSSGGGTHDHGIYQA